VNKESTFSYSWFDDEEAVLHCKCGVETEIGTVYHWIDILECKNCGRKYKIRIKIYLEELKEKEDKKKEFKNTLKKLPKYFESLKTDGDNLLKDLESQEDEFIPEKEAEKKIVGKKDD